ncbi:sodium/glucose cotransporter 4-like [Ruditapes philippinarum]|uniref:sodium/glucose cotransporter 4-like n=1 Tax=Ruditapes philippinarum TaxID=129788 RepID=UPI00295C3137|nr:sodium/glucose cotransporter 4-like [Ruditapes philippinarum]
MAAGKSSALSEVGDFLVVAGYFVLLVSVGIWSLCRAHRGTVRNYFLAGRSMTWIPVGASLYASNIGSEHFIGLAGTGAAAGISIIIYEWLGMPLVILLGWMFVPVYISAGVTTMPEYMEKRFGGQRIRVYLSILSLVVYIIVRLAATIFGGSLFIQMAMGWNMYPSIAFLLVVTGLFTILGGLTTVIYTDTFQTGILLVGSIVLSAMSFHKIGGYANLREKYMDSTPSIRDYNSTCGLPREDAFNILRDPINSDNPWPGLILQMVLGCMWYWCNDQVIVQRTLAAKTLSHAKAGSLVAGYLKILPMYIMVMPGMISRILFPDEVACVDPEECTKYCGNPVGCSNIAYPKLVLEILPTGLRGLQVAVMLAAIIGSLTSIFNSASTIFTMDLWTRIRSKASEKERLVVGRVFIVFMCILSVLWIPLVKSSQSGQLFIYLNAIQGYLATPIGALFLMAALWKRMTEPAAFYSLLIVQVIGLARLVIDFTYPAPICGEPETRPAVLYEVHYTYFCVMLFFLTMIGIAIISMFTSPRDNVDGLTWWTIKKGLDKKAESDPEISGQLESKTDFTVESESSENSTSDDTRSRDTSDEDRQRSNEIGKVRRILYRICGVPIVSHSYHSEDCHVKYKKQFFIEDPFWKMVLDISAVLGMVLVVFLVGFYH